MSFVTGGDNNDWHLSLATGIENYERCLSSETDLDDDVGRSLVTDMKDDWLLSPMTGMYDDNWYVFSHRHEGLLASVSL